MPFARSPSIFPSKRSRILPSSPISYYLLPPTWRLTNMLRTHPKLSKVVASLCVFLMVNLAVPMGLPKVIADHWPESHDVPQPKKGVTKPLTIKAMKHMTGRWTKNPYVAGANKYSVAYKGVD